MSIDVLSLWNFANPKESEERFREAMAGASPGDALILQTQVARAMGLQNDNAGAIALLQSIANDAQAHPEAHVRYHLEMGRSLASAAHKPEDMPAEAKATARTHYEQAFQIAQAHRLDYLAIDALHMMVIVDDAPDAQIKWNHEALVYLEKSDQADAKKWEGSLRNNLGYSLHLAGRYEEALVQFELSKKAREAAGREDLARVARWMIAWTHRVIGKEDLALQEQLDLERDCEAAGAPDPYVFEELATLYRNRGELEKSEAYAAKLNPA